MGNVLVRCGFHRVGTVALGFGGLGRGDRLRERDWWRSGALHRYNSRNRRGMVAGTWGGGRVSRTGVLHVVLLGNVHLRARLWLLTNPPFDGSEALRFWCIVGEELSKVHVELEAGILWLKLSVIAGKVSCRLLLLVLWLRHRGVRRALRLHYWGVRIRGYVSRMWGGASWAFGFRDA